jgi:hypothetical protein
MRIIAAVAATLSLAATSSDTMTWSHVKPEYRSFDAIKPVLTNTSSEPTYLSRVWPLAAPSLERFDEETKTWIAGEIGVLCGTVAHGHEPFVLRPGVRFALGVNYVAISGREFRPDAYPDATYPAEGRYRLVLRYAREPWTISKTPKQVFTTRSPEFRVRRTSPRSRSFRYRSKAWPSRIA